ERGGVVRLVQRDVPSGRSGRDDRSGRRRGRHHDSSGRHTCRGSSLYRDQLRIVTNIRTRRHRDFATGRPPRRSYGEEPKCMLIGGKRLGSSIDQGALALDDLLEDVIQARECGDIAVPLPYGGRVSVFEVLKPFY